MAVEFFVKHNFHPRRRKQVQQANAILVEFAKQGMPLTLRQLYYQFVARGLLKNNIKEYKNLTKSINYGRLSGLIDWDYIIDRTRNLQSNSHWTEPIDVVRSAVGGFMLDLWATQPVRPEVWIEKDAMIGVIENICMEWDVPYFSCRGYTSQSEMYAASKRLMAYAERGQRPVILHLGDHDPSGIHMSEDIFGRLETFIGDDSLVEIRRIALNRDQIRKYKPPHNPAKLSDTRYNSYVRKFNTDKSWELDALTPRVIVDLLDVNIDGLCEDKKEWQRLHDEMKDGKKKLQGIVDYFPQVIGFVNRKRKKEKEKE